MPAVPAAVGARIVSGMRWTVWLSAIAVPFSYGTSILLARVGPAVIGTYGLLMVYIGIVASLFYFGGDAVVIKFIPETRPAKRLSFLVTYTALVLGFLAVCVAICAVSPRSLQFLFGNTGGAHFQLTMLFVSPLYVVFSLVVAAHKAVLEMRWAHMLMRVITVGSFLFYVLLYVGWRRTLDTHYVGLIWGVYLGLTAIATVLGLRHLFHLEEWHSEWRHLRMFLPKSFWVYAITTEQVSIAAFLNQRLDLILVMNFGGITSLGKYVTVITVADAIRSVNRLFVDTLLPSLTNIISAGNVLGASQVVAMNLRLLFLVNFAGMAILTLLINPIIHLFGPQYASLRPLFILAILLFGVAAPGTIGGHLLSSVGQQHLAFWVCLAQVSLFLVMFYSGWSHFNLVAVVISVGVSAVLASLVLLAIARSRAGLRFCITRDYAVFAIMAASAGFGSLHFSLSKYWLECLVWLGAAALLLSGGNYTRRECRLYLSYFLPYAARC